MDVCVGGILRVDMCGSGLQDGDYMGMSSVCMCEVSTVDVCVWEGGGAPGYGCLCGS